MGTVGTTQAATAEVSDRSKRFGKSLSQSIFVSRCHKTTVNPRYADFVVENVALCRRPDVRGEPRESAVLAPEPGWRDSAARSDSHDETMA